MPEAIGILINRVEKLASLFSETKSSATPSEINLDLDGIIVFLKGKGYTMSKSRLYKLTANGDIPHRKFGNRLVFNTVEVLEWVDQVSASSIQFQSDAINAITRSAQAKSRNGY